MLSEELFKFAFNSHWYEILSDLEHLILPEKWSYTLPREGSRNTKNPILENYIIHTYKRLAFEYNRSEEIEKQDVIYFSEDRCCFNTGLFTNQYNDVYAMFKKNKPLPGMSSEKGWYLIGFNDNSDPFFKNIQHLPRRARYFSDIKELIYDTSAELRINSAHILANENNRKRIPDDIRVFPSLASLFDGAVSLAKKKVQANYKAAVPQFYNGSLCFLLPICLTNMEKADMSLAVTRNDGYYTGHTCLTIDMAYNNARLIARPDSEWLRP